MELADGDVTVRMKNDGSNLYTPELSVRLSVPASRGQQSLKEEARPDSWTFSLRARGVVKLPLYLAFHLSVTGTTAALAQSMMTT